MTATARRVAAPRRSTHPHSSRAASNPTRRPQLRVMPKPHAAANTVFVLVGLIGLLMLAAVVLHTRLAERQLEIDTIQREVVAARERFDVLRQQRAELRSPNRLAIEAADLGMRNAPDTEFLEVSGATFAEVVVAAGAGADLTVGAIDEDPLDQIRRVREAAES